MASIVIIHNSQALTRYSGRLMEEYWNFSGRDVRFFHSDLTECGLVEIKKDGDVNIHFGISNSITKRAMQTKYVEWILGKIYDRQKDGIIDTESNSFLVDFRDGKVIYDCTLEERLEVPYNRPLPNCNIHIGWDYAKKELVKIEKPALATFAYMINLSSTLISGKSSETGCELFKYLLEKKNPTMTPFGSKSRYFYPTYLKGMGEYRVTPGSLEEIIKLFDIKDISKEEEEEKNDAKTL